ncbi:unnamed protein product, partial [Medioppia subpectinata]
MWCGSEMWCGSGSRCARVSGVLGKRRVVSVVFVSPRFPPDPKTPPAVPQPPSHGYHTFDSKKSQKTVKKEKDINSANKFVKQLSLALRYFQDVVEKDKLEQLSGSVTIILEIVLTGYSELKAYLINNEQSSQIVSATNQVYQCLAELIRWSDTVLLKNDKSVDKQTVTDIAKNVYESVNVYQCLAELIRWSDTVLLKNDKSVDKQTVTDIAKNVYESVNSLVQLCIDRYNSRENAVKNNEERTSAPTGGSSAGLSTQTLGRPTKKPAPISLALLNSSSAHRSSLPEIPLSPREKEILETTNFPTPPPVPFRSGHIDRLNHSLSSDNVLNSSSLGDVFDGPIQAPPKPPLPVGVDGLPLSVSNIVESGVEDRSAARPPPLPPKRFPRSEKVLFSQSAQQSFDWSQTCQSSNCTSNCNSVDSCLNYSGLSHLSADDLLSMSRSDANSDCRGFRSQLNSYNTNSSSDENRSTTSSYNFSRFEYKTTTRVSQTTTQSIHSSNNQSKESLAFSLSSPPFHSHRIDSLIDKMRSFRTSGGGEDTVDGVVVPPELPVKMRSKLSLSNIHNILDSKPMRPVSEYDNLVGTPDSSHHCGHQLIHRLPNNTNNNNNNNETNFQYSLQTHTSCPHSTSCPHFMNNAPTLEVSDCCNDLENRPPPLPPKRRNIMAYMEMVDSYNGPESAEFYRNSMATYASIENQWHAVEKTFFQQRSITTSFVSGSSDDSVFSFESETSSTPPPSLPPKKKKSLLTTASSTLTTTPKLEELPELMPRTSTPVSLVPSSDSGISSQPELTRVEIEEPEELTALDETDVSAYIVLKVATDDGPDIRGGTVDGLIVKATEVSKN